MEPTKTPQTNNAGFILRYFAYSFDNMLFKVLLTLPLLYLITFSSYEELSTSYMLPESPAGSVFYTFLRITLLIFVLLKPLSLYYYVYMTSTYGATLGKMLFGLRVVDKDTDEYLDAKTAFYRVIAGYSFSTVFFFLGFLRIFKSPENYAWHDDLFNTKVTKVSSFALGIIIFALLLVYFAYLGVNTLLYFRGFFVGLNSLY